MEIIYKDNIIHNSKEWGARCFTGKKVKHWKDGQSAKTLAVYVADNDGLGHIKSIVEKIIGEPLIFGIVEPEKIIRFDQYGNGREHDLAISAKTVSGKDIFIGVEAKVDEPFGSKTVSQYYKASKASSKNTNVPERIEGLVARYMSGVEPSECNIRYQLLHSMAGTMAPEADISIFIVLVFKSSENAMHRAQERNHEAFVKFIEAIHAVPDEGPKGLYKYTRSDNRELYICYDEVDISG